MTSPRVGGALVIGAAHKWTGNDPPAALFDAAWMTELLEARGFEVQMLAGPDATRDRILAGYTELIESVTCNEAAVVYFGGHGGLMHDLADGDDPGAKPGEPPVPDAFQFIAPTDLLKSTDEDFRGISSWELSLLLEELTRKTHNVTVILDCCHSGQMSRGDADAGEPRAW